MYLISASNPFFKEMWESGGASGDYPETQIA
jgi:hypothetical protein